jgi:hypothetical protein
MTNSSRTLRVSDHSAQERAGCAARPYEPPSLCALGDFVLLTQAKFTGNADTATSKPKGQG